MGLPQVLPPRLVRVSIPLVMLGQHLRSQDGGSGRRQEGCFNGQGNLLFHPKLQWVPPPSLLGWSIHPLTVTHSPVSGRPSEGCCTSCTMAYPTLHGAACCILSQPPR